MSTVRLCPSALLGVNKKLLTDFLLTPRQGLSPRTQDFYRCYSGHTNSVIGLDVKSDNIIQFLDSLTCSNGSKCAYYRALRVYYNWLYSPSSGLNLQNRDNPIFFVSAPKVGKKILPSLTPEQVNYLIEQADNLRDKVIISLFADSGMRLSEPASVKASYIDWENYTVTIWSKGSKQIKSTVY